MSEWWTYALSDFLLFSPQAYYRLFELYNREIWPAQILTLTLGVAILVCLFQGGACYGRMATAILAACWLWVAWAFHLERYASINWAARYFAIGFVIEVLLLIWIGAVRGRLRFKATGSAIHLAGLGLYLFALLVQPLIGMLAGRSWLQAETFGAAPDPTVAATLGVLLLAMDRIRWILFPVPLIWCVISGSTLWAMEARDALMMPFIALLALFLAAWRTQSMQEA